MGTVAAVPHWGWKDHESDCTPRADPAQIKGVCCARTVSHKGLDCTRAKP